MAEPNSKQQQPAIGQKATLNGKPVVWAGGYKWQSPESFAKLKAKNDFGPRNPFEWIENELQWAAKQGRDLDKGVRLANQAGPLTLPFPLYEEPDGQVSTSAPSSRQIAAGITAQPLANAALAATNLGQRVLSGEPLKPRKPEESGVGKKIIELNESAQRAMGAKAPSELSPDQRGVLTELPSSISTNTALAFAPFLRVAPAAFSGLAAKVPFLSSGAQQVLARGLRWGANVGINEAASGILDDSTQGQAGDLLNAVGVPVPGMFLTTPEDDRISAGVKGILPGIAFGEALGAPLGIASKTLELAPGAMRNLREQRINGEVNRVRQESVNAGLQEEGLDGGYRFTQDETPPAATTTSIDQVAADSPEAAAVDAGAPAEMDLPELGVDPQTMPTPGEPAGIAGPAPEPSYSPELPELDTAALALERLDDRGLDAVAQGEGPVLMRIDAALNADPVPTPDAGRSTQLTAAPTSSLVEPEGGWMSQWESLSNQDLIGAADPQVNPEVFSAVQAASGKDWGQFNRSDALDGLGALQAEGMTVMPQRLSEETLVDVDGLVVDPERMQFRSGELDADGVAPGREIEGRWDTSKEGRVAVWQDPNTGQQVLVDGHSRVKAAREKGIRSLPADEVSAITPEAARGEGAIRNIRGGTAGPVDGGRAFRRAGINDLEQLQGAGIDVAEGDAAGSLAMARLPEQLEAGVGNGTISPAKALVIGGSGLDRKGMLAAGRFLKGAGAELSDEAFGEVLRGVQSRRQGMAPEVLEDGTEVPIASVGTGEFAREVPRAQVIEALKPSLNDELSELFDRLVVDPNSPASRLIEEGAQQVRAGGRPAAVANRLRLELEKARDASPRQELPEAPGEAQAEPEIEGPVSRQTLKQEILRAAIDGGEVRPSAQPVLPAPDGPTVDVPSAVKDLERQLEETGTIREGSPAAELLEEEARLEAEYAERDALIANELDRAKREAASFWDLSFQERLDQGLIETGWQPRAMDDTVDTRGQGRFFHGTATPIQGGKVSGLKSGDYSTDSNIFGNGFYSTEDFATAGNQYTQKGKRQAMKAEVPVRIYAAADELERIGGATAEEAWNLTRATTDIPSAERLAEIATELRGKRDPSGRNELIAERLEELIFNRPQPKQFNPAVYEVVEKKPVRFFDGERQIDWADQSAEVQALKAFEGNELWDEVLDEWENSGSMSYAEILDETRGASRSLGISRGETTMLMDDLNESLAGLGYGGMTHQGGNKAGGGKRQHRVKIYWEPEDQIDLQRIGATGPEDAANASVGSGLPVIPDEAVSRNFSELPDARRKSLGAQLAQQLDLEKVSELSPGIAQRFAESMLSTRGIVDLDKAMGATAARKAKQQFASGQLGPEANKARTLLSEFYDTPTGERSWFVQLGGDLSASRQIDDGLTDIVRQVAGSDTPLSQLSRYEKKVVPAAWGGDGVRTARNNGTYNAIDDVVTLNGVLEGSRSELTETAYHEAFHRLQYGLLTPTEM